jgi:hypothetical protein
MESWLQSWLFIAPAVLERGELEKILTVSVPAVLKRKGLESWLQPWLFIALLFLREENWRGISICTYCKRKGLES